MDTPVILAMDTSLGGCSVAIARGDRIAAFAQADGTGQQSRLLVPFIQEVIAEADVSYATLTAVACTLGPGGFTGIRVGLSAARAIALCAGVPCMGITTLEAMAVKGGIDGEAIALLDAYRGQCYAQRFRVEGMQATALSEALLLEVAEADRFAGAAPVLRLPADARDVALLASFKWARGERAFSSAPVYIREPDAKRPAKNLVTATIPV